MADQYEMLELFENFPKVLDEEVGIYEWKRQDKYGFTLKFYLCLCEGYCCLTLRHKDLEHPIFELDFHNVDKIIGKDNKLIIEQTDNPENIVVYFTPSYTLTTEKRLT